jgi:hypothetical protein
MSAVIGHLLLTYDQVNGLATESVKGCDARSAESKSCSRMKFERRKLVGRDVGAVFVQLPNAGFSARVES